MLIIEFVVVEVNECEFFFELCLYGKCMDIWISYWCECLFGYIFGLRGVMCKGKYDIYWLVSNLMIILVIILY